MTRRHRASARFAFARGFGFTLFAVGARHVPQRSLAVRALGNAFKSDFFIKQDFAQEKAAFVLGGHQPVSMWRANTSVKNRAEGVAPASPSSTSCRRRKTVSNLSSVAPTA